MTPRTMACPIALCLRTWPVPETGSLKPPRDRLYAHLRSVHGLTGRARNLAADIVTLPLRAPFEPVKIPLPVARRSSVRSAALAVATVLLLLATSTALPSASAHPIPGALGLPAYQNVSYNSSVDAFPLSFLEWLPTDYQLNHSYPLAVFLHGVGNSATWIRGGAGGLLNLQESKTTVTWAQKDGLILISLNTRSTAGFYQDTACGGPQRQDVLDAIAAEQLHRSIGKVYLVGFSMGSMGALALAASDPGAFAGVATVGTITDAYEVFAQNTAARDVSSTWKANVCLPSTASPKSVALQQLLGNLSQARMSPTAFQGVRLYVVAGALDPRATDNFTRWPYAQGNSTFVNSTCSVAALDGEPANCTVTFGYLHSRSPLLYPFRFVWEPQGIHAPDALPAADAFRFLLGLEAGGYFQASYPPTSVVPA